MTTKAMLRNEVDGKTSTLTASTVVGGNTITVSEQFTWGGTQGGGTGGATLTISARRGQQQIAPEGIAFFAEVEGFDAQKPTDGSVYDPTMHDIYYKWSFSDPGEYSAPEYMLPGWRDRNVAYGPFPSHVFHQPGAYIVTCIAIEKSSGKTATASIVIGVQDPEAIFTAATTVVCSTSSTWTGAPAHDVANRTTDYEAAITRLRALKSTGQLCRMVFRAGEVFQQAKYTNFGDLYHNLYVTSYGTGRATIRPGGLNGMFTISQSLPISGASISRIALLGFWDSTTETYAAGGATGIIKGVDVAGGFCTTYDCTASGLWQGFTNGGTPGLTAIFGNCFSTNWEDYGAYTVGEKTPLLTDPLTSYVGYLGCRLTQDLNALQGGNGKSSTDPGNRHGPWRGHAVGYVYFDVLDTFTRNSWFTGGDTNIPDDQAFRDHRNKPRSRAFFSRMMLEGGWAMYANGSATGSGHEPTNTVLDKVYFLSSPRTRAILGVSATAFTARNFIAHYVNKGTGEDVAGRALDLVSTASKYIPAALTEPIRIYNGTIINEKDEAEQKRNNSNWAGYDPVFIEPGVLDPSLVQVHNIVTHRPNFPGGFVGDGPLDSTRLGFVPRYLGYEWKAHGTRPARPLDTFYSTPPNPWSLWRPQAGSPAIGSATGLVAYDDLLGNVRPPQASRGAIEPA